MSTDQTHRPDGRDESVRAQQSSNLTLVRPPRPLSGWMRVLSARWLVGRSVLRRRMLGFTLLELVIGVAIVAIIASVAFPTYQNAVNKSRFTAAKRDILEIQMAMERYFTQRNRFPDSLDEITTKADPWGNPYRYLAMEGASVGQKRKDKSLHPLNTDYDLYSMGPDGKTATALTAKASRDDVVRANNGGFIGWGEDF